MRGDGIAAEAHARQHVAVGDAGRGEEHIARCHLCHVVDPLGILDAHAAGAGDLFRRVEQQTALHLTAGAAKRGSGQHTLRRTAYSDIDIDAGGLRIGRVNDARDITVADQADGCAGRADLLDQPGMAWPVHDAGRKVGDAHALGLGNARKVLRRRKRKVDYSLGIAGADRDLVHVDIGRMQHLAAFGQRNHRQRIGQVLGADGRAFQRVQRDIDRRAVLGADLLADIEHRRLVALALADHHAPVDGQVVELGAHGVHCSLVGGLFIAMAAQAGGGNRGALGHARQLDGQDAVDDARLSGFDVHKLSSEIRPSLKPKSHRLAIVQSGGVRTKSIETGKAAG